MIQWLVTLPVVAQITLLCGIITAITNIAIARPKLVLPIVALIVFVGLIGFLTLPTPSKRILERIGRGDPFHVVLHKGFGALAAHQVYSASYAPNQQEITVIGLHAQRNEPFYKNTYPCKSLDKGYFNLWNHGFSVDDYGFVVDRVEGRSGTIYFDEDVD